MGKQAWLIVVVANISVISGCVLASSVTPPLYAKNSGFTYCQNATIVANKFADWHTRFGIVSSAVGAAGIVAGTMMGPDPDPDWAHDDSWKWIFENRNLLTTGVGSALVVLGLHFFSRADAAADFASVTGGAMKRSEEEDRDAYNDCVTARSVWISSQKESNQIISNEVLKLRKQLDDVEKETESVRKRLEEKNQPDATPIDAGVPPDGP